MKYYLMVGILDWQTSLIAQGNFVYRNGAEVTSGINIDLNLDNTTDFTLTHPVTAIGDELRSSRRLTPIEGLSFGTEIMKSAQMGGGDRLVTRGGDSRGARPGL